MRPVKVAGAFVKCSELLWQFQTQDGLQRKSDGLQPNFVLVSYHEKRGDMKRLLLDVSGSQQEGKQ